MIRPCFRRGPACLVILALLLPGAVAAQVVFTVDGRVLFNGAGYTANQVVSLSFTLNDFAPATPVGEVNAFPTAAWEENTTSDPQLWTQVSGTGISGAWQRPTTQATSPSSSIQIQQESDPEWGTSLSLSAWTDTSPGNDTGLLVNGVSVAGLSVAASFDGLDFTVPDSLPLPDPTEYFKANVGHFDVLHSNGGAITLANISSTQVLFNITGITISYTSPIPEPGACAVIAGAIVFATAWWRRRTRESTGFGGKG